MCPITKRHSLVKPVQCMKLTIAIILTLVLPSTLWVLSETPWENSVEILNINPTKWYLLTGSKDEIYSLGRKSYFTEKELGLQKDSSEFLHTESMLLIDKKGRIRGIYNATQKTDIIRVIDDVRTLMKEG